MLILNSAKQSVHRHCQVSVMKHTHTHTLTPKRTLTVIHTQSTDTLKQCISLPLSETRTVWRKITAGLWYAAPTLSGILYINTGWKWDFAWLQAVICRFHSNPFFVFDNVGGVLCVWGGVKIKTEPRTRLCSRLCTRYAPRRHNRSLTVKYAVDHYVPFPL